MVCQQEIQSRGALGKKKGPQATLRSEEGACTPSGLGGTGQLRERRRPPQGKAAGGGTLHRGSVGLLRRSREL